MKSRKLAATWHRAVAAAVVVAWPFAAADAAPGAASDGSAQHPASAQSPQGIQDCPECPQLVVVPAGSFLMGSPPGEEGRSDSEGPQRRIHVRAFAIGRYEISRREWDAFVQETYYPSAGCNKPDEPVACVTWHDAWAYTLWLKSKTGRNYRLPTEAEWEYAARAGTSTARFWGQDPDRACRYANVRDEAWLAKNSDPLNPVHRCNDGFIGVAPVGHYEPNAFGLYDMIGNVWEWVEDCWHPSYKGAPADARAWVEPDCPARILRGGATGGTPQWARTALRGSDAPTFVSVRYGFRVARDLQTSK